MSICSQRNTVCVLCVGECRSLTVLGNRSVAVHNSFIGTHKDCERTVVLN